MERLTAEDRVMLWPDARWPQDVGALAVLDGRGLFDADGRFRLEHARAVVAGRLHRVPRFRQVLLTPRLGLGGPLWVDAPAFDLTLHVREVPVLDAGEEGLLAAVERLLQQRLDRSRPLWEMWFLTGTPGRVALFVRMHHTMGDGIASMATLAELLDDVPDVPVEPARPWTPAPPPTSIDLLTDNLRTRTRRLARALAAVARPATWRRARDDWPAVRELAAKDEVSETSLNQVVGEGRHLAVVRTNLDLVRAIGRDHGATVNDILLTLTAAGLRAILSGRGEPVDSLRAGVYVPVTLRRGPREAARGNLIAQMVVTIPLGLVGPRRLEHIAAQTATRKLRDRPSLGWLTSNRITRRAVLTVVGHQPVNVTTADLPGPDHPVYLAGSRLLEVFPVLPLIGNVPLAVGALSYARTFTITAVADPHVVPDLDTFVDGLRDELYALATASRPEGRAKTDGAAALQPAPDTRHPGCAAGASPDQGLVSSTGVTMNVLVVYATKYGSTAEIAQRIASVITACGHTAVAKPSREVRTLDGVGAVVVGSAVYLGSWLKDASAFVDAHREQLREHPVWLFSSGPLPGAVVADTIAQGAPEEGAPKNLDALIQSVGAREHRVFAGRLDPSHLKGPRPPDPCPSRGPWPAARRRRTPVGRHRVLGPLHRAPARRPRLR